MKKKKILSAVLFIALMALTFYVIFKNQDAKELWEAVKQMHKGYLALAVISALFFTAVEGYLIWYLLRTFTRQESKEEHKQVRLLSCLKYSFVGFFYSGITPSATGGQPMQLYYMSKDGHSVAKSTVVLLSVAVSYKLVLVLMGVGVTVFWWKPLTYHLGGYLPIYFLGLFLNTALVGVLLLLMLNGPGVERFLLAAERRLVRWGWLKQSEKREQSMHAMVEQYHETVCFLKTHVKAMAIMAIFTTIQRCSVFGLTYLIYLGMGLEGAEAFSVMALQGVVYIAVDMLPLPGAQGITELVYAAVFQNVFLGRSLTVSMCVTRGINFYFLLIVSACVAAYCWWSVGRKQKV